MIGETIVFSSQVAREQEPCEVTKKDTATRREQIANKTYSVPASSLVQQPPKHIKVQVDESRLKKIIKD